MSCNSKDAACNKSTIGNFSKSDLAANVLLSWDQAEMAAIVSILGAGSSALDFFSMRCVYKLLSSDEWGDNSCRTDIVWTDPAPYTCITAVTSQICGNIDNTGGLGPAAPLAVHPAAPTAVPVCFRLCPSTMDDNFLT